MPAIEVDFLQKSYGPLKAVDGISFNVNKGEVFSLLGPNGAGKTTSVEIMEGLRERDAGDVNVLGFDPWKKGYDLHTKIGVIPQNFRFFDYPTPREAVAYYGALFGRKVDADSILRTVLLDEVAKLYYMKLSGGQKQKLGLALALVNDPELLFLDEPTTGLDPQARRAVWDVIRTLKKEGRTVFLTTHYLEEAETLADKVAIMHHGRIIASGTPAEIISEHGASERLAVRADERLAKFISEHTNLEASYEPGGLVSVILKQRKDALAALEAMEESGIPWDSLTTRRDSLEDIFVRMVGEEGAREDVPNGGE